MNRKGQALVEFVLILPVFLLILFAIVDFGIIINKKNQLENSSVDIVSMIRNGDSIADIKLYYPELSIEVKNVNNYIVISISENIDVMTPGLNLVLGDPYKVYIERVIPNV